MSADANHSISPDTAMSRDPDLLAWLGRWYGTFLLAAAAACGLASVAERFFPGWSGSLVLSLLVATVLLVGGELFIIALPFSWGTAQVSVGSICSLGVAMWLGPAYAVVLILLTAFLASYRQWRNVNVSIENAASAAISSAIAGIAWWELVPHHAMPLTSIRTTVVFVLVAVLHSVINFGTVAVGTAIARRQPILRLIISMSGGRNFIFTIPFLAAFVPLIGSQSPLALLFFALPLVSSHLALRALWRLEHDTQTTLAALTDILELRDPYTAFHSERVSVYAVAIAARVSGLTVQERATLERAARIHDIGKAAVRDEILLKTGKLTDEERRTMESHSSIGADLIARMHAYRDCVELIRHHHERWDGGGYPSRLMAERIPLGARVMAVADSLDAMTTDRPYRSAMSLAVAIDEIQRNSRTQFDPDVVDAFMEALSDPVFDELKQRTDPTTAAAAD